MGSGRPGRFSPAARDVADALRFFTRLNVGGPGPAAPLDLGRIAWAAPIAGAAVGLIGALILALTALLGVPLLLRAALTTAALVALTGALHEDGLADVADGFGGGATRAMKLEIMRDSRIGAYGAIALALALILRVGALAAALDGGFWRAALSLILVAALSRAAALTPLALLPPARADGAGAAAGPLELERARRGLGLGPCHWARARRRRAWLGPRAPRELWRAARALWRWSRWLAARSAGRPATSPAPRNNAARSPPGAGFSLAMRPPR